MGNVVVIFASNAQAETPQLGASDRAAIGLAVSRFTEPAAGFCPEGDQLAMNYGAAANIARVNALRLSNMFDFEVAILGQCALSEFGAGLAGSLAETRNATLLFDVLDVHREGDRLRIIKDTGHGNREEWIVRGPVVMLVAADANRPPYVSRYRRMMATRYTEQRMGHAKPAAEWEGVRPRVKLNRRAQAYSGPAEDRMSAAFGISAVNPASTNDRLIVADAATCARNLIRYLAHHGFLPANMSNADRKENLAPARSPKPQTALVDSSNVSMSQRAARGPRFPNDSPQRLARRPRVVHTTDGRSPANARLPRCPRPVGRMPTGLARRPRSLND